MTQPEAAVVLVVHDPGRIEGAEVDDLGIGVGVVLAMVAEGGTHI